MAAYILSVSVRGQPTFVTYSFATIVQKSVMAIRTRQSTTGAERLTHQDAREVTARLPSDCIFTVRFFKATVGGSSQFHILTAYKLDHLSVVYWRERTRILPRDDDRN